jgi:hypothetical protein
MKRYAAIVVGLLSLHAVACGGETQPTPQNECNPDVPADITAGSWSSQLTVAGLGGYDGIAPTVYDFARDHDGTLLAVGYFHWLGSERVEPFLRLRNGAWEPARSSWNRKPPRGGFSAIAVGPSGEIALATSAGAFAGFDREIWLDRGNGFEVIGKVDGPVRALEWFNGNLWVAGTFNSRDTAARDVAIWNGTQWSGLPGGALDSDGHAYELLVTPGAIYVGGVFHGIGGISAVNVASWDGSMWRSFDNPDLTIVFSLARSPSGELIAGGFTYKPFDGMPRAGGIMRWTGASWAPLGAGLSLGDLEATGEVTAMTFLGSDLYVSGCFEEVNGDASMPGAIAAHRFARWDGTTWHALDDAPPGELPSTAWAQYQVCGQHGQLAVHDVENHALVADGQRVYAGGMFSGAGRTPSQALIAYDGTSWIAQGGAAGRGFNGTVTDFAIGGQTCDLYALGTFSHAGGVATPSHVVRRTDTGWEPVGSVLPANVRCDHIAVDRAAKVSLGCTRQADDGSGDFEIFELSDAQWQSVATLPASAGNVAAMKRGPDGKLWIVGAMFGAGGEGPESSTGFVAYRDGASFVTLEDGFDGAVSVIDFPRDSTPSFLVGGSFTHAGGVAAAGIARWDGAHWTGVGAGLPGQVRAIAFGTEGIYASTTAPSAISRWDGSAWTTLSTPARHFPNVPEFDAVELAEVGGKLVVAGAIYPGSGIDGDPVPDHGRNAYVFDGENFSPFGDNVSAGFVNAMAVTADGIWLGGSIAETGAGSGEVPSVGAAEFRWTE